MLHPITLRGYSDASTFFLSICFTLTTTLDFPWSTWTDSILSASIPIDSSFSCKPFSVTFWWTSSFVTTIFSTRSQSSSLSRVDAAFSTKDSSGQNSSFRALYSILFSSFSILVASSTLAWSTLEAFWASRAAALQCRRRCLDGPSWDRGRPPWTGWGRT